MTPEKIEETAEYYDSLTGACQSVKGWFVYAMNEVLNEAKKDPDFGWNDMAIIPDQGRKVVIVTKSDRHLLATIKDGSFCINARTGMSIKHDRILKWKYV